VAFAPVFAFALGGNAESRESRGRVRPSAVQSKSLSNACRVASPSASDGCRAFAYFSGPRGSYRRRTWLRNGPISSRGRSPVSSMHRVCRYRD
jgi:hypothetical protein